jgi:hypothetical protein
MLNAFGLDDELHGSLVIQEECILDGTACLLSRVVFLLLLVAFLELRFLAAPRHLTRFPELRSGQL